MTQSTGGHLPPHKRQTSSTPEVAKQEAAEVAQTAAHRTAEVGDTAGEQAKRVASETVRQARDLVDEGRGQLAEQAREGQRKAASGLHTLADELGSMSAKSDGQGLASEVVSQAAARTRGVADWLGAREPGALLGEVRAFARRKPGVFLAGAVAAGVLVGRLTRGAVSAGSNDGSNGGSPDATDRRDEPGVGAVPPAPPPGRVVQPISPPGTPSYGAPGSQAGEPMPAGTWPEPAEYPGPVTR
jgi:hypothetical protein